MVFIGNAGVIVLHERADDALVVLLDQGVRYCLADRLTVCHCHPVLERALAGDFEQHTFL
jgi:hypothetical protein